MCMLGWVSIVCFECIAERERMYLCVNKKVCVCPDPSLACGSEDSTRSPSASPICLATLCRLDHCCGFAHVCPDAAHSTTHWRGQWEAVLIGPALSVWGRGIFKILFNLYFDRESMLRQRSLFQMSTTRLNYTFIYTVKYLYFFRETHWLLIKQKRTLLHHYISTIQKCIIPPYNNITISVCMCVSALVSLQSPLFHKVYFHLFINLILLLASASWCGIEFHVAMALCSTVWLSLFLTGGVSCGVCMGVWAVC
jgi:hypothetical protein